MLKRQNPKYSKGVTWQGSHLFHEREVVVAVKVAIGEHGLLENLLREGPHQVHEARQHLVVGLAWVGKR